MKPAIPVIKFKLIALAGALLALYVVRIVSGELAAVVTDPPWLSLALRPLASLATVGIIALLSVAAWYAAAKFISFLSASFTPETIEITPPPTEQPSGPPLKQPEQPEITDTVTSLDDTLAKLENGQQNANTLIADAEVLGATLVGLIQGIALQSRSYQTQAKQLDNVLVAIQSRDPIAIARAAGAVRDIHLQQIVLTDIQDDEYWASAARTLAAQAGALNQWAGSYRQFSQSLLADFSQIKMRLLNLRASSDLVDVARPMLTVQHNIDAAAGYLKFDNVDAARALPSIHNGRALNG